MSDVVNGRACYNATASEGLSDRIWRLVRNAGVTLSRIVRTVFTYTTRYPLASLYRRTARGVMVVRRRIGVPKFDQSKEICKSFNLATRWFRTDAGARDADITEDESDSDVACRGDYGDRDSLATRCCICLKKVGSRGGGLLFPCFHNSDVHTSCAWNWVCHHPRTDPESGTFHISCPMCRSTRTAQLVSYRNVHGPVSRRPTLRQW